MNAPLPVKVAIPSLAMSEQELVSVLGSSVYPNAKPESIKLAIAYCRGAQLDPLQKPVHIVPMDVKSGRKANDGKDIYEKRDVIMPGVGLYRIQASRSQEYAGMTEPEFGPEKTIKLGKDTSKTDYTFPEWCKVTVRREVNGRVVEFTAIEYWLENYATAGRWTTEPNAMWKKRPRGQLAKCAEAQALRKAFPELGAAPTADEMEGKVIDAETVPAQTPQIAGPQSRSAPATIDAETGEVTTQSSAPAATGTPSPATTTGGAAPDQPMKPSQAKILQAKLKGAALSELDLEVAFPGKALEPKEGKELFGFGQFNDVTAWIEKNRKN
jgi:phage recombination protein Bet